MKTKILISAANGVVMTSLIKRLRKKFYIIGIDADLNGHAKKYCNEFYLKPNNNEKNFIKFINKIGGKVDYIFLYNDRELLRINRNRKLIQKIQKKIVFSPKKTIDICLNKKKFYSFCKLNQINTPSSEYTKEMIVKPIYGTGSKDIIKINSKIDYNFFLKKKNMIIQKFINGHEYTVDCLFDRSGNLLFALPRMRILHRGVSIVGKIVKDKKISEFVEELSKKLIFNGPINIQVIKDKNNQIWVIEINPRMSGSIEFSILAGFNPFLYYQKNFKLTKSDYKIKYNKIYKRFFSVAQDA